MDSIEFSVQFPRGYKTNYSPYLPTTIIRIPLRDDNIMIVTLVPT